MAAHSGFLRFSIVCAGLKSYGNFLSLILGVSPVTVFLPTDAAWSKLRPNMRRSLQRKSALLQILKYYTVRQWVNASTLSSINKGARLLSLEGSFLEKLGTINGVVVLGWTGRDDSQAAQVTCPNCYLTGLVAIHGIDTVLWPPDY